MGVIPNLKMAFIFPVSCILALIFPILIKYFPKCEGKGSFQKSQIKSLQEFLGPALQTLQALSLSKEERLCRENLCPVAVVFLELRA